MTNYHEHAQPLDLHLNQVKRIVVDVVAALPATPTAGRIVYLTTNGTLYWADGAEWHPAGGAGGIGIPGLQGEPGEPGERGPQGPRGATGATGAAGADGSQGRQGPPGPAGDDAESGAMGPPGPRGQTGATGAAGAAGAAGPRGFPGATGLDGEDGEIGPPGMRGATGSTGATGPTGAAGRQGPPGYGVDGEDGSSGPPGKTGATGATGPQGRQGPPGICHPDDVNVLVYPPDYSRCVFLIGRGGGQVVRGGLLASETLQLISTAHATRGKILLGAAGTSAYDEVNDRLGIGTAAPNEQLEIAGNFRIPSGTASVGVIKIGATRWAYARGSSDFFGLGAGNLTGTGVANVGVGGTAINGNTTGGYNSCLGYGAGSGIQDGAYNVAIGYNASAAAASANNRVVIGSSAHSLAGGGSAIVYVGESAGKSNASSYVVGIGQLAVGNTASVITGTIALGYAAGYGLNGSHNILAGYQCGFALTGSNVIWLAPNAGTAAAAVSNALIIGERTTRITDAYLGGGHLDTAPAQFRLQPSGGSGTNIAGAALALAGGKGTGTGVGGSILFQTADLLGSGTTLQSLTTKATLDYLGRLGIGVAAPTAVLDLKAGTATAGTAPLKLASGTLLAAPEAGALEFVTDTLSFTITTGAARKIVGLLGSATPLVESGAGAVGTSGYSSREDHVHPAAAGSLDITGLTAADPALGDESPIYDISASANRKVTIQEIGGFVAAMVSELRLTLTTATPVTTADVTAAGTLYLTPYIGNRIRIYDGTRWNLYHTAELSLALTLTSGNNYDVFVYDNAGTLTLEVLVWTNDTTRATALVRQDGVLVKSGATTRLYLGTIRASAANVTEDSDAKRFLWNMYNRVPRRAFSNYINNHTYNVAAYRQFNNDTAAKVEFVNGLAEDVYIVDWAGLVQAGASGSNFYLTYALDSTSANSADGYEGISGLNIQHVLSYLDIRPAVLGYHYIAQIEYGNATDVPTYWSHALKVGLRC